MHQQQTQRRSYNNLQQPSSTCDSAPTHSSSTTTNGSTTPITNNIQTDFITFNQDNHSLSASNSVSPPPKSASVSLRTPPLSSPSPPSLKQPPKISRPKSTAPSSSTVIKQSTNSTPIQQQQQTAPTYSQLSVLEREDETDSDSDTDSNRLSIVDTPHINNTAVNATPIHSHISTRNLIASHNATTSTSDIHKNNTIHIGNNYNNDKNNSNKTVLNKSTDRSSTPTNHKRQQYQQQEGTVIATTTISDTATDAQTVPSTNANNSVIIVSGSNGNNSNTSCSSPIAKHTVRAANSFGGATLSTSDGYQRKLSRQDIHNRSNQAPSNSASTNTESNGNDCTNTSNSNNSNNNNTTTTQRKYSFQGAANSGIKISVVGSPEVFGHRFVPLPPSSAAVRASTPDSEYERIIKRYDLMNATSIPQLSSSSFCTIPSAPQLSLQPPILYPSILLTEANARANNPQNLHEIPVNYSTSLSDFRPPKKRSAEMSSSLSSSELKSSSATSHTTTSAPNRRQYVQHPFINHYSSTQRHYQQPPPPQTSAFVEHNRSTPSLIPSNDQFQEAMNHWDWYQIDDFIMPVVLRANQRYAAVQIVQLKLLSKFPPNIPTEMTAKFIMVSHKMSAIEAWILNSINAVITKFDLGCHLFTPNDEIVRVDDVERFYWSVKEWNMKAMIDRYNAELHDASSTHLMAVITKIRNSVQESIQEMERTSEFGQSNNSTENVASLTAPNKMRSKLP